MIKSKKDYLYYLEMDRLALSKTYKKPKLFLDEIWKYQRILRKVEYLKNCKKGVFWKYIYYYYTLKLNSKGLKLGFSIQPNCFGPGLSISHPGTIVVNGAARIGNNCRIHDCVVIGTKAGHSSVTAKIGNNAYIGPGVKLFGDIEIGNNIAIGANSVVNKSFLEDNITIAGIPAKKVSNKGSKGLIIDATGIIERNTK